MENDIKIKSEKKMKHYSEITRILEIMNIDKTLINESSIISDFSEPIINAIVKASKEISQYATSKYGIKKPNSAEWNDFFNQLTSKVRSGTKLDAEQERFLGGLIKDGLIEIQDTGGNVLNLKKEIYKDFILRMINDPTFNPNGTISTEKKVLEEIAKQIQGNDTISNWMQTYGKNSGVEDYQIPTLENIITKNQLSIRNRNFVETVFDISKGGQKILKDTEIKYLNEYVNKVGKLFWTDLRKVYSSNVQNLKQEIRQLSNGYGAQLMDNPQDVNRLTTAYSAEISRLFNLMHIKSNTAVSEYLKDGGLPDNIVQKIKTSQEPFFVLCQELRSPGAKISYEDIIGIFKNLVKELQQQLLSRDGDTFFISKFVRLIKGSAGQYFFTGQWASFTKLYRLMIKQSAFSTKTNGLKYLGFAMAQSYAGHIFGIGAYTVLGAIIEICQNLWNAINNEFRKKGFTWFGNFEVGDWNDVNTTALSIWRLGQGQVKDGLENNSPSKPFISGVIASIPGLGMSETYASAPAADLAKFTMGITKEKKGLPPASDAVIAFAGWWSRTVRIPSPEQVKKELDKEVQILDTGKVVTADTKKPTVDTATQKPNPKPTPPKPTPPKPKPPKKEIIVPDLDNL